MKKTIMALIMAVLVYSAALYPTAQINFKPSFADVGNSSLNSDMPEGGWNFSDTESSTPSEGESGGGGGSSDSGGGLLEVVDWLKKVVDGVTSLPKKIAEAQINLVQNIWGMEIDSFLNVFSGVLSKAFTNTVYPGTIDWVSHGNAFFWIICTVFSILFLTINMKHVIQGKKQYKPVLTTFALAVVLSVASVQIVNVLVWLSNSMTASLAQVALDKYTAGGIHLDLKSLTAQQIMSIPFQEPSSFGTQIAFHTLFVDPIIPDMLTTNQAHGGILALVLATAEWFAMDILVFAKIAVLYIGTILAPIYISMAVWGAVIEPAVGWVTLMSRVAFLPILWTFGWTAMVFVQAQNSAKNLSNLLGADAVAINILLLGGLVYVTYRYWLKPTIAQLANPVTLAGGVVLEKLGQAGEKVGRAVQLIGMATMQPEIVTAGGTIGGVGKTVADRGRDTHGGRTIQESFDLSAEPPEIPIPDLKDNITHRIEERYENHQAAVRKKEEERTRKKYWTWQGRYIIRDPQTGLPQEVPVPPEGYVDQGEWQGESQSTYSWQHL
ncbi:MAG: hypothetical protein JL50_08590 [Peptococcaceae bacterium BICA1-7]|nr:MAG: hypothetical protein JL50_08590 [Peptococcaceae bacterium BICA1-7]HBV97379.1 hypothetical protein [Desulfotomaculum sp.]